MQTGSFLLSSEERELCFFVEDNIFKRLNTNEVFHSELLQNWGIYATRATIKVLTVWRVLAKYFMNDRAP